MVSDTTSSIVFYAYAGASVVLYCIGLKFFLKRHVRTERAPFGLPVRGAPAPLPARGSHAAISPSYV